MHLYYYFNGIFTLCFYGFHSYRHFLPLLFVFSACLDCVLHGLQDYKSAFAAAGADARSGAPTIPSIQTTCKCWTSAEVIQRWWNQFLMHFIHGHNQHMRRLLWLGWLKYCLAFGFSVYRNGLKLILNMVKLTKSQLCFLECRKTQWSKLKLFIQMDNSIPFTMYWDTSDDLVGFLVLELMDLSKILLILSLEKTSFVGTPPAWCADLRIPTVIEIYVNWQILLTAAVKSQNHKPPKLLWRWNILGSCSI